MDDKQNYSVRDLSVAVILICCGLGFLTVLIHAPTLSEGKFLVIPLMFTCWGAAVGGFWNHRLEGAKAGLLMGFVALLISLASISSR